MSTTALLKAADFKKALGAREGAELFKALDAGDAKPGDGVFDAKSYEGNLAEAHQSLTKAAKAAERLGLTTQVAFANARDAVNEKMIGRGRRPEKPAVKVDQAGPKNTIVNVTFASAGKEAKGAAQHEIWSNDKVRLSLDKFEADQLPDHADRPPYQIILRAQPGVDLYYHREGNGSSSLSDDWGQIISAGSNVFHFYASYNDEHAGNELFRLEFKVDQDNDYHYPVRPPVSAESRALKKDWGRFWHTAAEAERTGQGGFVLEGTAKKPLEIKTLDEMRALPGPAALIKHFEKDWDVQIEDVVDRLVFAFDPKGKSYAVGEYTEGEGDHRLYIFNSKGEFSGFYRVQDDLTREWLEGFQGELGKP